MNSIRTKISSLSIAEVQKFEDVLYVKISGLPLKNKDQNIDISEAKDSTTANDNEDHSSQLNDLSSTDADTNIFYFRFGCVVIFGPKVLDATSNQILHETLNLPNALQLTNDTLDFLHYRLDNNVIRETIDVATNELVVKEDSVLVRLSVAYALAQSVKLTSLENSCDYLIERTKPIQEELAHKGSVSLSKRSITKRMGELFAEKYRANLHSETLDTPEFFWRKASRYEEVYLIVARFQELNTRQKILNKKLDIIQELYAILSSELNHMSSTRLEIIIILLIATEIILGLFSHPGILSNVAI